MPQPPVPEAIDAIAADLYALPPGEFTAARNAKTVESDPALVALLKALRRPTVAAWAVNLLVRHGQLADVVELSVALREAQDDLDAPELAKLGRQRRALVAALAGQAVTLAGEAGVTVSAAARDDVEKTINAAVTDAAAAAAVLTGRLIKPLAAGALEPADLADAVAGSIPGAAAPAPADDLAERRARKAAERAAREAERTANEAERSLAQVDARRAKARERVVHLSERLDEVRRDLARLEAETSAADDLLASIEQERNDAASRADAAAKQARAARRALD